MSPNIKEKQDKFLDKEFVFNYEVEILKYLFQYFFICDDDYNFDKKLLNEHYLRLNIENKQIKIIFSIINKAPEMIKRINIISNSWRFKRMGNYEKSVLLYGYYYLKYKKNISYKIILWFCVENAKRYSGEKSFKIINAILHKIYTEERKEN